VPDIPLRIELDVRSQCLRAEAYLESWGKDSPHPFFFKNWKEPKLTHMYFDNF
jgi:hypothetical protein